MNKRFVSVILAGSMLLSLASCNLIWPTEPTESKPETESSEVTEPSETEPSIMGFNMINNGDFASKDHEWHTYFEGGDGLMYVNDKGELEFDCKMIGTKEWASQLYYDGFALYKNCKYEIQFDCYSDVERDLGYRIQINGSDYHAYSEETIHVGTEVKHFDITFTMEEATDPAPRLCFNLGKFTNNSGFKEHTVCIDNIDLRCIDDTGYVEGDDSGVATNPIAINQIGYLPNAAKIAVMNGDAIADEASVIDCASGSEVFKGKVSTAVKTAATGREEARFDFSSVTAPGTYKIVSGSVESYEFKIGDGVYTEAFKASLRMFYLQRCGMELTADLAGDFSHPACHTEKATIFGTKDKIDVSGGWHDAGDYGRYVVSGAKAAADLMLAYSLYPEAFDDALGIPESGNNIPDVLDEVKYELDWLFKMQNSEGGVYHKVTCANFPSFVMPEEETEELIVTPVSTTATADFAAVMAMASYVYAEIDMPYSQKCLDAAMKAAKYLDKHQGIEGAKNPDGIVTGEYPDTNDADERLWAYAELFKATGDTVYDDEFSSLMSGGSATCNTDLGWQGVGAYAGYAYLSADKNKGKFYDVVHASFMAGIAEIEATASTDSYNCSLKEYPWGSNMTVANNGMLLLLFDKVENSNKGDAVAREQLNYLLGTNGTGYCFLTGYGTLSPQNPHHRPSQAKKTAVPGMLAGGPNQNLEDPYAQNVLTGTAPALCYADSDQAFSLNEVTIYWNSPLVFLFAYVAAKG